MKLKLPDGPFKAYLFDCDGTIVDSMPLHYVAWKTVLAEWGCEFDEALFYSSPTCSSHPRTWLWVSNNSVSLDMK